MITPMLEKGKNVRQVYLPEKMTKVFYDGQDFHCSPAPQGWQEVEAELHQAVFFIRQGKLLPIGKAVQNTAQLDLTDVQLLGNGASYELYADDGFTKDCSLDRIVTLQK